MCRCEAGDARTNDDQIVLLVEVPRLWERLALSSQRVGGFEGAGV
jgi:hypothetical protein